MESTSASTPDAIKAAHGPLSSTPLRLVLGLCLISIMPEICWAIGIGLESSTQGFWPSFWRAVTDIVFAVTIFISPIATLGAMILTVLATRFKQVAGGVLALMWLLVVLSAAAEVAHLHGYIGFKKRIGVPENRQGQMAKSCRPYGTLVTLRHLPATSIAG